MATRWTSMVVLVGAIGLCACSGDDGGTTASTSTTSVPAAASLDELAAAPADSCPVALDAALIAAGIADAGGATGRVLVASPPPTSTTDAPELTPLQRLDGVEVDCFAVTPAGDVHLLLVAGRLDEPGAAALSLLPTLASRAELSADALEPIAAALPSAPLGTPVELPGDAPVAFVRTALDGAADAAFLVWSDGLTVAQVQSIAAEVDAVLP